MPEESLPRNTFNRLSIPDEIGNLTVNDLMDDPNTEVVKKGNKLTMRREMEQGVATLELSSYATGRRSMKFSSVPNRERKKDYTDDIVEMKKSGMLQKEIAFELGMSEAYVSRILQQYYK